jgi:CRISPR-associated protein Csd2
VFSHADAFPAHTLVGRITAEPTSLEVPRSFGDYKITLDDHDLPPGITLERLTG